VSTILSHTRIFHLVSFGTVDDLRDWSIGVWKTMRTKEQNTASLELLGTSCCGCGEIITLVIGFIGKHEVG
jgi:hypothetical protein